jgi:hypothetical protein
MPLLTHFFTGLEIAFPDGALAASPVAALATADALRHLPFLDIVVHVV